MESEFMVISESAANVACRAKDAKVCVQNVDASKVLNELVKNPLADGSIPEIMYDES